MDKGRLLPGLSILFYTDFRTFLVAKTSFSGDNKVNDEFPSKIVQILFCVRFELLKYLEENRRRQKICILEPPCPSSSS